MRENTKTRKIIEEIFKHLYVYDYICIDDFLLQKSFEGDVPLVKSLIKKYFRMKSQKIDLNTYNKKNSLFIKSKSDLDEIVVTGTMKAVKKCVNFL